MAEWVCKHYDVPRKYLLEHTTINLCKLHLRKLISFPDLFFFQLVNVNVARLCRVSKIEICEFYGSLYNIIHIVYRCSQFQSTLVGNYEPMPASCSSFEAIFETVSVEWLLILVVNKNDTEMSSPRASSFLPGKKNYRVGTASFSTFEMDLPLLACIV